LTNGRKIFVDWELMETKLLKGEIGIGIRPRERQRGRKRERWSWEGIQHDHGGAKRTCDRPDFGRVRKRGG